MSSAVLPSVPTAARLEDCLGEPTRAAWASTYHGYGREVRRSYQREAGRGADAPTVGWRTLTPADTFSSRPCSIDARVGFDLSVASSTAGLRPVAPERSTCARTWESTFSPRQCILQWRSRPRRLASLRPRWLSDLKAFARKGCVVMEETVIAKYILTQAVLSLLALADPPVSRESVPR